MFIRKFLMSKILFSVVKYLCLIHFFVLCVGSVHVIMITLIENGHADWSSNPG